MTSNLTSELTTLSDSLKATDALITRLSTLTFHPGSEPLSDSTSVRTELTHDIRDSLKQLEEDFELLKQEAEDLAFPSGSGSGGSTYPAGLRTRREGSTNETQREHARLAAHIARLGEDLQSSRAQFRRAQLNAKKASELAKRKEREAVFASLQSPPPPPPPPPSHSLANSENPEQEPRTTDLFAGRRSKALQPKTQEQQEIDATTSVTTALRRTHALLSTELSRSRFAQETFDQSTAALAELGEKYSNLDAILKGSRELLGTLLRSQKSDTWYLETAFYILVATLGWLIFRRILLGPFVRLPLLVVRWAGWIVWKPLVGVLYLTGVVTSETVSVENSNTLEVAGTRPALIVQPSAAGKGDIPRFDEQMAEQMRQKGGVPVGAGGAHAKQGHDLEREGQVSEEEIRKMAEQGEGSSEDHRMGGGEGEGKKKRADGTVLEERGDVPPNPKKKMFEADVEDAKVEAQQQRDRTRDEL